MSNALNECHVVYKSCSICGHIYGQHVSSGPPEVARDGGDNPEHPRWDSAGDIVVLKGRGVSQSPGVPGKAFEAALKALGAVLGVTLLVFAFLVLVKAMIWMVNA